jgi:assimilatory nitrate reductase catalytic subunit
MNACLPLPSAVHTTCPYCGVGCGLRVSVDRGTATIAGDTRHPANHGRLCSKGSALGETLGPDGRLLHPMLRDPKGCLTRTTWETALEKVATGIGDIVARHGPDDVAFYLSGQLLTEDYYVANKLMKGFIGSANVDTNSRLCMASSVAGYRRAFGSDTVPGSYEDLELADLLVLVGSNAAWCHPVAFQRMLRAKEERGAVIVNVDVRGTATGESADLDLRLDPGTDAALFAGLLVHLDNYGAVDRNYVARHTENFAPALSQALAIAPSVAATAAQTGLDEAAVERFFDLFRSTKRVVTLYSQGVNQSLQGTDKVNAIINCHLATGRIGRPGMGPFSLTGQPNAMGGREVGGLANQLAAHMDFAPANVERVGRFWNAPNAARTEGLKAVDMFEAIGRGDIKALWVMGTNPAVSLPRADHVVAALGKLDLLVVSENVISNDTVNAGAHVLLPAAAWGEKDGTVTNSERRISRQRAFLPPCGEARPDWWIVSQVAQRLGFGEAFAYPNAAAIFREHCALTAFENDGSRDLDLGGLASLDDREYARLQPVQWPVPKERRDGTARLFGDGRYYTPSRKARFVAVAPPTPAARRSAPPYPLLLGTGRVRDQWHTMTRSGAAPSLATHTPEPFINVHRIDARRFDLTDGGFARVVSTHGQATLRVRVTDEQEPDSVFAPIHWSGETSIGGRVGALVHALVDPVSGQPDLKGTPVAVSPVRFLVQGFALTRTRPDLPRCGFLAHAKVEGGLLTSFASDAAPDAIIDMLGSSLGLPSPAMTYVDSARGARRCAWLNGDAVSAVLFLATGNARPDWRHVTSFFAQAAVSPAERLALVAGRSAGSHDDPGPLICACFGVSRAQIVRSLADGACDVGGIGERIKAGTNCGSCVPELKRILREGVASAAPSPDAAEATT